MVYAEDLKSFARNGLRVRVPPLPPRKSRSKSCGFCYGSRGTAYIFIPFIGIVGDVDVTLRVKGKVSILPSRLNWA